jgi:peptide-methionine (R)-S-oxide reductase
MRIRPFDEGEKAMISRRLFLGSSASLGAVVFVAIPAMGETFEITKTAEEWQAILSPDAFAVLREEATERPFTSALLEEHREGTFTCAGCELPLFASNTKYDSGTGWPSFWAAIDGAIGTTTDHKLLYARTECHCARCGGHLGHIFDDGPEPTGLRHCINGVALGFVAA